MSLNPLEIGECFRPIRESAHSLDFCLNPLEIGECFRHLVEGIRPYGFKS